MATKRKRFDFNSYALIPLQTYIREYKDKFPDMTNDIKKLNQAAELLADDRPEEAWEVLRRLDTFVREGVPGPVYDYCRVCSEILTL